MISIDVNNAPGKPTRTPARILRCLFRRQNDYASTQNHPPSPSLRPDNNAKRCLIDNNELAPLAVDRGPLHRANATAAPAAKSTHDVFGRTLLIILEPLVPVRRRSPWPVMLLRRSYNYRGPLTTSATVI